MGRPRQLSASQASAAKVWSLYRLGRALPAGTRRGPRTGSSPDNGELAKKFGFSGRHVETARRAARLVSPQGFTRAQLGELIAAARAKQRGNVFFVVWTAMAVPPRARFSIAKTALEEGWSAREMQRQILARYGRRRALGRHRQFTDNPRGVLGLLESATTSWLKMTRELLRNESCAALPRLIARRWRAATARVQKLHEGIQQELAAKGRKHG